MHRTPVRAFWATLALAVALGLWTWLSLSTAAFAAWDASALRPGIDLWSIAGQVAAAVAVLTWPGVTYSVLVVVGVWAYHRRLRNLAWALVISVGFSWGGQRLIKALVQRPRPPDALPLFTAEGWAYPSGHMAAITTLGVLVMVTVTVARARPAARWAARLASVVVIVLIGLDRWLLRAHYPTDIVAGALWGALSASAAVGLTGVHVPQPWSGRARASRHAGPARLALIVNPTKVPDWAVLRQQVEGACAEHGWPAATWLETEPDDPGAGMTRRAIRMKADLVLVAGGDGTVRTVCAGLAGSGIPLGIVPVGTGNLLARNLGIPLDVADALDVAFAGEPRLIDLVRLRLDDSHEDHYSVVMAGVGADAEVMAQTNPDLKRVVGSAAYAVAAVQAASRPPFGVRVEMDGDEVVDAPAAMVLVANVGQLTGGITMVPDARADDGRLDLVVAQPRRPADWVTMAGRVVGGLSDAQGVQRRQGRRVLIETEDPVEFQIDGDTVGRHTRAEASVEPGALTVLVPPDAP